MIWLITSIFFISAYCPARNHFKRIDEALLAAGLLAASEVVVIITLLGGLGLLKPLPVLSLTLLMSAAHLSSLFRKRRPFRSLPSWKRICLVIPWPLWPALALTAAVLAFRFFLAVLLPFDSWDGMSYHLPIVLRWLQQGNFDLAGWMGPARYFPWNGELLPVWLALLDGGNLEAAKLAQGLALPLWAASGAVLGRRLAGARWAVPAALALTCVPIALIHLGIPYVDFIYAAFWLAAAAAALCFERKQEPYYLFLYAAGFGLAAGTKSTLYFQLPLLLPVLWTLRSRENLLRRSTRLLPFLAAVVVLTGGVSYLHNWWTTGNPIYPYSFRLGGVNVFNGIVSPGELLVTVERWFVPSSLGWLWYPFHETMKGATVYSTENGFGPLFAAGWVFFPFALWKSWKDGNRGAFGFLLLLPATAFFFLTLHPTREQRYVIFLSALPILGLAYVFRRASGRLRLLVLAGWTFGAAWSLCGFLNYVGRDTDMVRAWTAARSGVKTDPYVFYRSKFGALGEAWAAVNERLAPGDVVAVNYGELILPWAGLPPRGKVLVVGHKASIYPQTLTGTDTAGWMSLLDGLHVRYFALWSPAWYPDEGKTERDSIAALPGRFVAAGNWQSPDFGQVELYEIIPGASPAQAR